MSRRLVVVGCAGDSPLYGFDSRAGDDEDEREPDAYLRAGDDVDDDDDEAELADALDEAERALKSARDGTLDVTRAGFALQRAGLALERHGHIGGQDSAAGEVPARSVERLRSEHRNSDAGVDFPEGRTRERSTMQLERAGNVDHRRDFDSDAESADDALPPELRGILPAGRGVSAPARVRQHSLIDGPLLAIDAAAGRSLAARVHARQQRDFNLNEACGLV